MAQGSQEIKQFVIEDVEEEEGKHILNLFFKLFFHIDIKTNSFNELLHVYNIL